MRRKVLLTLIFFLMIASGSVWAQSEFQPVDADNLDYSKIFHNRVMVRFDTLGYVDSAEFAASCDYLKNDREIDKMPGDFFLYRTARNTNIQEVMDYLTSLDEVFMVNPVMKGSGCNPHFLTNELIVSFNDHVTEIQIDSLNEFYGTTIVDIIGGSPPLYVLSYNGSTDNNLLDIIRNFANSEKCANAESNSLYSSYYSCFMPHGMITYDLDMNVSDIIYLINHIFLEESTPVFGFLCMDVNCDFDVNLLDVVYM